jgi:hypothetical protein
MAHATEWLRSRSSTRSPLRAARPFGTSQCRHRRNNREGEDRTRDSRHQTACRTGNEDRCPRESKYSVEEFRRELCCHKEPADHNDDHANQRLVASAQQREEERRNHGRPLPNGGDCHDESAECASEDRVGASERGPESGGETEGESEEKVATNEARKD